MEWRPARWSVCLPLLISPCTIKSICSLLAPAHPGGPGKRAVKRLCGVVWWWLSDVSTLLMQTQIPYKYFLRLVTKNSFSNNHQNFPTREFPAETVQFFKSQTTNKMAVLCGMPTIQYSARSACLSVRVI